MASAVELLARGLSVRDIEDAVRADDGRLPLSRTAVQELTGFERRRRTGARRAPRDRERHPPGLSPAPPRHLNFRQFPDLTEVGDGSDGARGLGDADGLEQRAQRFMRVSRLATASRPQLMVRGSSPGAAGAATPAARAAAMPVTTVFMGVFMGSHLTGGTLRPGRAPRHHVAVRRVGQHRLADRLAGDLAQEGERELAARPVEDDAPRAHRDRARAVAPRILDPMERDHRGDPLRGVQRTRRLHHALGGGRVERCDGLVGEDDLRALRRGLGDADADGEVKREREILANGGVRPFQPSSNSQLLPFREIQAHREIIRVEGDETLWDAEKAKRIEALRTRIGEVRILVAVVRND
jgi:hypothetical protein